MLVVMQEGASEALIQKVIDRLIEDGFDVHRSTGIIHTVLGGVGGPAEFDTAVFEVDALVFERFAAHSGRTELEIAANRYAGAFLEGLELDSEEFESWRRAEAARYLDKAVDVLSRLMKLLAECGETERAIEAGAKILRLDPLHEATARQMMQLYAQSGRRGTAIQLYRALTKALRRDVNAQPESETRLGFSLIAHAGEEQPNGPSVVNEAPPRRRAKVRTTKEVPTGLASGVRPEPSPPPVPITYRACARNASFLHP